MAACMGLSTWLKERRLERTHAKLKSLRARQADLRHREQDLANSRKAGMPSTQLEAKQRAIHEERERVTAAIRELEAEEKQLKLELGPAA
jgi:type II secretory pathway component PulM